ncbi:CLUMA_CG016682, isoform A [Clunio marinus]|uniref:CLUMA_CG016682, isoform A n=1 Tax=Clunio marinus TaxID=568069 RepID=A0A1J1IYC5_9DIPT|nr:CLUMA_CG016682, isoform A [Clunio marinus]
MIADEMKNVFVFYFIGSIPPTVNLITYASNALWTRSDMLWKSSLATSKKNKGKNNWEISWKKNCNGELVTFLISDYNFPFLIFRHQKNMIGRTFIAFND